MSMQRCEYCDKNIDTDFDVEHFHKNPDGMCQAEQERLEFPIYCKDEGGVHVYMILNAIQALVVTNVPPHEIGIVLTQYGDKDHIAYERLTNRELILIEEKYFQFHRIEINNRLISVGVSKEAQNTKSES